MAFDFANILFAGPCNARCPFCIGQQIDRRLNVNNLNEFPPRNLDRLIALCAQHAIRQIVLTGSNTDPLLYRHLEPLLARLRHHLPGCEIALHTNGRLAPARFAVVRQFDRVCVSVPSFNAATYFAMMGVHGVPDLAAWIDRVGVPPKISCALDTPNQAEIPAFLAQCRSLGIRRVVLRQLVGDDRRWPIFDTLSRRGTYRGQPVYDYAGLEVTHWSFEQAQSTSLNLFSTGVISEAYRLEAASADLG